MAPAYSSQLGEDGIQVAEEHEEFVAGDRDQLEPLARGGQTLAFGIQKGGVGCWSAGFSELGDLSIVTARRPVRALLGQVDTTSCLRRTRRQCLTRGDASCTEPDPFKHYARRHRTLFTAEQGGTNLFVRELRPLTRCIKWGIAGHPVLGASRLSRG
jgi:hypothetical protein